MAACLVRAAIGLLLCLVAIAPPPLLSQQKEKLTIEWMNSPESFRIGAMPQWRWLPDGMLLWDDPARPQAERRVEVMDPATGKVRPFVDTAAALGSIRALVPAGKAPQRVAFPSELDAQGTRALYVIEGDIFVLDVPGSTYMRVTSDPGQEKSPRMSPDGRKVAYVRGSDLCVNAIDAPAERRLTADGTDSLLNGTLSWLYWEELFTRRDVGYWWSPDSRAIAFLQTDESGVSIQHWVDFKPWTPRVIRQRYPKVGEKNPRVRLGIVELESGKITWADLSAIPYEYIARVGWTPDGSTVEVRTLNRLQTEMNLVFINRQTGAARRVLTESSESWVSVRDDFYFLKDGKHFLWPSERTGYLHLYRYTMDGTLVNPVTSGQWSMHPDRADSRGLEQAVVSIDEAEGWVYFNALEKSPIELHLYRVRLNGNDLERLSKEEGRHDCTMSPRGDMMVGRHSSGSTPPSLRLFDSDGSLLRVLAEPRRAFAERFDVSVPEFLEIPARDGFALPAMILKPTVPEPGRKYPVIFSVYGGPGAHSVENSWSNRVWDNILVQNGFIVMAVDNRSATAISKTLEETILGQLMGEGELNDLVDAVRWVKRLPYVDSSNVGIWGWSGGGSFTMLGMSRSKEFRAGINVAGVSDQRFYDSKWTERTMKTEVENRGGYEQTSLLRYAKDLHGTILLVHGTYDDNVHPQNMWAFQDELIKANKKFEMMVYPMRGHGISDHPARMHLYTTMLDFWKRQLQGD
jgi:dipeptidyl-peptidase-4